jgi:hypothetical protein
MGMSPVGCVAEPSKGSAARERSAVAVQEVGEPIRPFNTYEVVNPVEVNGGTVAPWFGQGGGGIQYEFDSPIADLIDGGYLKAIEP